MEGVIKINCSLGTELSTLQKGWSPPHNHVTQITPICYKRNDICKNMVVYLAVKQIYIQITQLN